VAKPYDLARLVERFRAALSRTHAPLGDLAR